MSRSSGSPSLRAAEVLELLPVGAVMWLPAQGGSMEPLLHDGDGLKVVRCAVRALGFGDIAVLWRSDGTLVAHLVSQTTPLRTVTFLGAEDPPGMRLLGRVIAVRRYGRICRIPPGGRVAIWMLHLASAATYRRPKIRAVLHSLRTLAR